MTAIFSMKQMLKLNEFFVEGKNQKTSHVLLHITEPTTPAERLKGYFFAVVEMGKAKANYIAKIQKIIDDMEEMYYAAPLHGNEDKDPFEHTIETINQQNQDLYPSRQTSLDAIMGVVRGNKISFVYHGKPLIRLFYLQNHDLHVTDVLENGEKESDKDVFFSSLIEGEIRKGDSFFIATPHINSKIPDNQLKKVIDARTVDNAVQYIQKILHNERSEYSYGGILFYVQQTSPVKKIVATSHKQTIQTDDHPHARKNRNQQQSALAYILSLTGKFLLKSLLILGTICLAFIKFLGRQIANLVIIITNKGNNRVTVIDNYLQYWRHKKEAITSLPLISKILLILVFICAFIFAGSIYYVQHKKATQLAEQEYHDTLAAIKDKKDAAEASLIYDDQARALSLLLEAKNSIASLPENDPQRTILSEGIDEKIEKIQKEVQHMVDADATVLATLDDQSQATKLALVDDTLVAFGPQDNFHYQIDKDTGNIRKQEHQSILNLGFANTPKENDTIVFLAGPQRIATYSKDSGTVGTADIQFPVTDAQINSLFVYNQTLYTLDVTNQQIYKHNRTQTGYDRGSAWLKQPGDIADAVSMAIDGDIYVLKQNGTIAKFSRGATAEFSLHNVAPTISNPQHIWTYNDIEYIYILDAGEKRVIVIDKQGNLVKQYIDSAWQSPTGMVVDDDVLYVLDKKMIYRVSLK